MTEQLSIKILRDKKSYKYKRFPNKKDDWFNNDDNNMLDDFILFAEEDRIFSAKVQTVANIPFGRFLDTIMPGEFDIKLFVENRKFYGDIHGICNCFDFENQRIDENSVQKNDATRWLVHDTQSLKPKPAMLVTRVAWSAGCFIMSSSNLNAFSRIVKAFKYNPGEFIHGILEDK